MRSRSAAYGAVDESIIEGSSICSRRNIEPACFAVPRAAPFDVRAETPSLPSRTFASTSIIESEIGVQPPPQASVQALGAFDVGYRNDDDLADHIDRPSARGLGCMSIAQLWAAHGDLRE
jgi:hypothetical protein